MQTATTQTNLQTQTYDIEVILQRSDSSVKVLRAPLDRITNFKVLKHQRHRKSQSYIEGFHG